MSCGWQFSTHPACSAVSRTGKASNAKLEAGGSTERILEAEVITEPPPIPAEHSPVFAHKWMNRHGSPS